MYRRLQKNRIALNRDLQDSQDKKFLSPAFLYVYEDTVPRLQKYAYGRLLDVGCGDMPFRKFLPEKVTVYHGLDKGKRGADVHFIGDAQDMHDIGMESYETVMSLQVLEHVPDPFRAMKEMHRVLTKGGVLILSVPHLSRLHEEPFDFYRYTKYGLRYMLEQVGFEIVEIVPSGGIFSFLGHQISTIAVCLFWHVPMIGRVAFFLNKWLCTKPCFWLDQFIERKKIFAMNYICIAKKSLRADRPRGSLSEPKENETWRRL
jgi:SAM-dependent methyltransferase